MNIKIRIVVMNFLQFFMHGYANQLRVRAGYAIIANGIICLPRCASFPVDECYEEPGMTLRNRTRRTPFILFTVLLIAMLAVAGCGGKKEEKPQETAKKPFLLPRLTVNITEDGSPPSFPLLPARRRPAPPAC